MKLSVKLNLVLVLVIGLVLAFQMRQRLNREVALFETEMRRDHHVMGRTLRNAIEDEWEDSGRGGALAMVPRLDAREEGLRIRLVTPGDPDPARRPDAPADALGGLALGAEVSFVDHGTDPGWLYSYVPLTVPSGEPLVLELRESLSSQQAYIDATQRRFAMWLALMVAATSLVVAVLMRWIVGRPIERLIAHSRQVATGDFSARVGLDGADELGQLGREVDQMTAALQAAEARVRDEQEAKVRAVEQLRHADRLMTVGQLAAGVAHELGTPLNVAMARAKMIATWDVDDEADARANAKTIADQCERMTVIIRQLLDFARPRQLEPGPEDLRGLAAQAVSLVGPLGRKREVTIGLSDGSPLSARVDRGQLQQVLFNLLANALDATPPGGRVDVTLDATDAVPPAGSGAAPGRFVRIRVRDTGSGIAPEHLPHVFEPFFTTKDVGQGTGLGLSVSHGIVRDHGGFLTVDSTPGQGTTFAVYLPSGGEGCAEES